jgi:hypothetical protein
VRSANGGDGAFSAAKLQHDLTRSLEATAWTNLYNTCGRYQQALLTSLSLNPATSAWLSAPPLSAEPGYRLSNEDYRLAIRHRLGQLPYDELRDEQCVACAGKNTRTPSLLVDPDHAHSCTLQEGASVRRRHDALKLTLAKLARSCGYLVEVEPRFPTTLESRLDLSTGQLTRYVHKTLEHGDLLLIRGATRELIDTSVARPNTLTRMAGSARSGAHLKPLVAAAETEARKHAASARATAGSWCRSCWRVPAHSAARPRDCCSAWLRTRSTNRPKHSSPTRSACSAARCRPATRLCPAPAPPICCCTRFGAATANACCPPVPAAARATASTGSRTMRATSSRPSCMPAIAARASALSAWLPKPRARLYSLVL